MARAENYRIIAARGQDEDDLFLLLLGRFYGRRGIPDGSWSCSSSIVKVADDHVMTESGARYDLGESWPADKVIPAQDPLLARAGRNAGVMTMEGMERLVKYVDSICQPEAAATEDELARFRRNTADDAAPDEEPSWTDEDLDF
ncbi:hypothetical protein [Roseomonas genomospecies 6]|uniref:hypothetical protein n=1 Tax=Roseomonas genomospecies 6 TaxID=214106 RepID=UPI0011F1B747|nr:hypothetical protein [Roseomonas genomospecies 6]